MTQIEKEDYLYKSKPYAHQHAVFITSRDLEAFALFFEQRTGKSKVLVDTAAWLYGYRGKIDALLIFAPAGMYDAWVDMELPLHMPDSIDYMAYLWDSTKTGNKSHTRALVDLMNYPGLKVLVINTEALNTKKVKDYINKFVTHNRVLCAVDESQDIKNPQASRTKAAIKIARFCEYRRLLTGTPNPEGPTDLYSQYEFLDPKILGFSSFYSFRAHFCILTKIELDGRKGFHKIVGHKNLEELNRLQEPYMARVLLSECYDMPVDVYNKVYVNLSTTQRALYDELKAQLIAEFMGKELTAPIMLTKMLRLQQITGGHFPYDDGNSANAIQIDERCPRVEPLLEILRRTDGKVIIWCRFTAEIKMLLRIIPEEFGADTVVTYYGEMSKPEKWAAKDAFQDMERVLLKGLDGDFGDDYSHKTSTHAFFHAPSPVRFFVGQPRSGGAGLTLSKAVVMLHYSNGYGLKDRLQCEMRGNAMHKDVPIHHYDFIARNTGDNKVVTALRNKKKISDMITGDTVREWV